MILPAVSLSIPRSKLMQALKILSTSVERRRGEEAILSFDGTFLLIELGGGGITVPATGECSLQLRVPGALLLGLVNSLPDQDPLILQLEDRTHLRIGTVLVECVAQPIGSKVIDLPMNAANSDVLNLLGAATSHEIEQSGLSAIHARALALQNVTEAARLLKQFGITEQDLIEFVQKRGSNAETLFL